MNKNNKLNKAYNTYNTISGFFAGSGIGLFFYNEYNSNAQASVLPNSELFYIGLILMGIYFRMLCTDCVIEKRNNENNVE